MPREDTHLVEIGARLVHETELAVLLDDGDVRAWVPKSQCEPGDRRDTWVMTERVAIDKEFV
jgi:hypothetical protein